MIKEKFNPRLKEAMKEIVDILNKYDIAAVVALHSQPEAIEKGMQEGFGEFLFKLNPSYSCCKILDNERLQIRAKAIDFDGDTAKRDITIIRTANMLAILKQLSKMLYRNIESVSFTLDQVIEAEHEGGEYFFGDLNEN